MPTTTATRPPRRKDGPALIRSGRVNKTRTGEVYDRSVPLTRDDARAMATTLSTLAGFSDVRALSTKKASSDGRSWFVRWHRDATTPNPAAAMQEVRVERAIHQAAEMEAFLSCDDRAIPKRWVLHRYPESDQFGLYLVTLDSCTCPDHQYRGRAVGACKHMNFLLSYLQSQRRKRTVEERALDARLNGW